MARKATIEDVDKIAEELRGSCISSVQEIIDSEGFDENSFPFDRLDSLVFKCEECGWWCEISEMADGEDYDRVCRDCDV